MKVRTTKSNLTTSKEIAKEEDCPNYDEGDKNVDPHNEGQNEEETRENVDSSKESLTKVVETSTKRMTEEPEEKNDTKILKRKSTMGSGKAKSKVSKREKSEIEEEELKALEVINKLASAEENKVECEIFGELVTTELKALSQKQFLMAKHEIQNVLFKVRMEALEADLNDRPTEKTRTATTNLQQHPSTSTLVSLSIETPYQSTTQPQIQLLQPYNSNNFDINSLGLFMAQVQDTASYNINSE